MAIVGFDFNALSGWYQAQNATRMAGFSPKPSGASAGNYNVGQAKIVPPWDVRGDIAALEDVARKVLGSGQFFAANAFSKLDAPDDHKTLFTLHQGLRSLYAVAHQAAEKSTTDASRLFLDRRFQEGAAQLSKFFDGMDLTSLSLLQGQQLSKAESEIAISRGFSEYVTGAVHVGAFDAEVESLAGDVRFTVSVTKNGATQHYQIDLADMGATPRNLDNIAEHINSVLEANEVVTRFSRVKLGEKDSSGLIPGNNFGFKITGVPTERLSFSAENAAPAVYIAGVSGQNATAAGQIIKLTGLNSGDPDVAFTRRMEAEADIIETVKDNGDKKTITETNPLTIKASAMSADGALYVVGETGSGVDGQLIRGDSDLVLAKYDSTGKLVWTRTLGAAEQAAGAAVTIDGAGNVIVAGSVIGAMSGTANIGGSDSFVVKYNASGVEQWIQRFGGTGDDRTNAVTVGADGAIYVAGEAASAFGGTAHQGGAYDGYVRAISTDGTTLYTRREGDAGDERAKAIAVAADGGLLVASVEDGRAVLRKYAAGEGESAPLWELDFGDMDGGRIGALAVDENGDIYFAGAARAGFAPSAPVSENAGGRDAVLVKISDGAQAAVAYTTFLGSDADDSASSIRVVGGKVYLAGKTTGSLPGSDLSGSRNAFAAQLDAADGSLDWTKQVSGRGGLSEAAGVVIDPGGDSVLDALGLPRGAVAYADTRVVTDRTSVRAGDHFFIAVDGGRKKKIAIAANDTLRSLTFKINAALLFNGSSDVRQAKEGDMLRITPKVGSTIEIFAGADGADALKGLGLQAGSITRTKSLLDKDKNKDTTSAAPKIYALDLPSLMALDTRPKAAAAMKALEDAMSQIQKAYRELTTPQAVKDLLESGPGRRGGTVPAYLQAQYANYAAGLDRLQGGGGGGGGFF